MTEVSGESMGGSTSKNAKKGHRGAVVDEEKAKDRRKETNNRDEEKKRTRTAATGRGGERAPESRRKAEE